MNAVTHLLPRGALCLVLAAAVASAQDRELQLAPGATEEVEHRAASRGTLSAWAECDTLDLELHATRSNGWTASDDDTGGGNRPWLVLAIDAGEVVRIRVAAKDHAASAEGTVRLFLRELRDTDAAREAEANANALLSEALALDAAGDRRTAVTRIAKAIEVCCSTPTALESASLQRTLKTLGRRAVDWLDIPSYLRASLARREALRGVCPPTSEDWSEAQMAVCQALTYGASPELASADCDLALELAERFYAPEHVNLAITRMAVAQARGRARELERAEELMIVALADAERSPRTDVATLAQMRSSLGALKMEKGELAESLDLHRSAVEALQRTRLEDDDLLLAAKNNLAATLSALGEHPRALEIHENRARILGTRLDDAHPELLVAQFNCAVVRLHMGDWAAAAERLEEIAAAHTRAGSYEGTQGDLVDVALAEAWTRTHRAERAFELVRQRERYRATQGRRDAVLSWRLAGAAAHALIALDRHQEALVEAERALPLAERAFPPENPDLAETRQLVASLRLHGGDRRGARELAERAALDAQAYFARCSTLLNMREAENAQRHWSRLVADGVVLLDSTAADEARSDNDERVFALCESARAVGVALLRQWRERSHADGEVDARLDRLRDEARRSASEVARLGAAADRTPEFDAALERRRRTEEELRVALARELGVHGLGERPDTRSLARALAPDEALVAYWRVDTRPLASIAVAPRTPMLIAFVVRGDGSLRRFALGELAPIASAVERWRGAIESGEGEPEAGAALRTLVVDPLSTALEGVRSARVALDDTLHLAPLEALPLEDGARLGDRLRVRSAPGELLSRPSNARSPSEPRLVALGGVDYDASAESASPASSASRLRAEGPRLEFEPLWETQDEIDGVARLFRERAQARSSDDSECVLLSEGDATKSALLREAARATHLHIATHGFYAASRDAGAERQLALARRAPLSLCGLALAGANDSEAGPLEGLVTADELAMLDLSRCELVVVSACESNVGMRDAGQGVASFQKALHAAGARYVATSLWRVGDAATRELMLEFYTALWLEGQAPEDALWRAKSKLRSRRAPVRDWAAWVLSSS